MVICAETDEPIVNKLKYSKYSDIATPLLELSLTCHDGSHATAEVTPQCAQITMNWMEFKIDTTWQIHVRLNDPSLPAMRAFVKLLLDNFRQTSCCRLLFNCVLSCSVDYAVAVQH